MKKTAIILSACVAFSACKKNVNDIETSQTQGTPAIFSAVTENVADQTKTAYENSKIKWFKNDKINVLYHTSSKVEKCEFTNLSNAGEMASFQGDLVGTKVTGEPYYAVYPTTGSNYDLTDDGKVKFTVTNNTPQNITQAYSFAQGANYTFAATVDGIPEGGNTLYFKNAQSIIRFTVPAALVGTENFLSIAFTPNNEGCSFNGTYICEWDKDDPIVTFEPNTSNRTVSAKNGSSSGWGEGKPYFVTIPPVTYKDGIMVDVTLKDNKHIVRYNFNDFKAERAKMYDIGTLTTTADLLAVDLNVAEVPAFFNSKTDCSMDEGMLKVDKSATTGTTTGFFTIDTKKALGETAYDASAFNTVRFKVKYNPEMVITSGDKKVKICMSVSGSNRMLASRVNGKKQDGEEHVVKTDGSWNIVELDIKEMNSTYSTLNDKRITIYPFAGDVDASFNSKGTNRICWIKDIEFIKK